MKTFSYYSFI